MQLTSWGKFPYIEAKINKSTTNKTIEEQLYSSKNIIGRGLGRSYGDSALAENIIDMNLMDHFHSFDAKKGLLTCSAGVSLDSILTTFVPKGWFLSVTPGTKFVTVGGAIASDVHGKNHHLEGSFSDHVVSIKLATVSEGIIECSRIVRPELFFATCGGMGLTGVILDATFRLKSIRSAYIDQKTIKVHNLQMALELFEEYEDTTYSVAWIDCLSTGKNLGRSLLMLGEHSETGDLITHKSGKLNIPLDMPPQLLNKYSIQAFNSLYYHRLLKPVTENTVHYDPFFYPLDGIHNWNRMYGKTGFTQYQFVLPKSAGLEGMTEILTKIAESKRGSFLAVLKAFGKGNENYLSFPIEGYTLALDFKLDKKLFILLDELDNIVKSFGGRVYLSKDVRMSEAMFKESYPQWHQFMSIRNEYQANNVINSLQSMRLGI